jgi:hypothetical protein
MRTHFYIALALLCGAAAVNAAAQTVQVDVQSTRVTVGAPFAFRVTAAGERVARPVIPHAQGLIVNRTPNSEGESIQIQFSGGQSITVRKKEWIYYATPQRAGALTLPAIEVLIDGVNHKSEPITLHAQAPAVVQPPPVQPQPGTASPTPAPQETGNTPWPEVAAFVESEVSKHEVFQGEPVVMTLRIGQVLADGVSVAGPRNVELPSTEGFYSTAARQEEKRVRRNNFNYKVNEISQTLYPLRTGRLTIDRFSWMPARAYRYVRGSLLREEAALDLRTPAIVVEVKPLPEPPPAFTGAVGRFRMSAALAANDAEQGEPVDLVVRISGEGNPNAIGAPALPELEWAHVSGPELDLVDTGGGQSVTKTFRYTITPLDAGRFEVPPIPFAYFEPNAGGYRSDETPPLGISVTPSTLPLPTRQTPALLAGAQADDIWSITHTAERLRPVGSFAPAGAAVVALPPAAWLGFFLFVRRRRRLETDTAYARDIQARAAFRKRLNQLAQSNEPLQELYRAMADYLADKFNVEGAGLTALDAEALLEAAGAPPELVQPLVKVMRACERQLYADARLSAEEAGALAHAADTHIETLEAHLRGRRIP